MQADSHWGLDVRFSKSVSPSLEISLRGRTCSTTVTQSFVFPSRPLSNPTSSALSDWLFAGHQIAQSHPLALLFIGRGAVPYQSRCNISRSKGFVSTSTMPARMACSRVSASASAVRAIIGVCFKLLRGFVLSDLLRRFHAVHKRACVGPSV